MEPDTGLGTLDDGPETTTLWTGAAKAEKGQGWLPAGIDRFTELCSIVRADRDNDDGAFDQWFLDNKRANLHGVGSGQGGLLPSESNLAAACDDAYSDDDE